MQIRQITEKETKQFEQEWEEADTQKGIAYSTKILYFGAYIDSTLAGYIKIKIRGGVGNLSGLIVKKEMRNMGIGNKLIEHFEEISKKHSCHKLTIRTSHMHEKALALYKSNGYMTEATFTDDKNHLTWYQLCKRISG